MSRVDPISAAAPRIIAMIKSARRLDLRHPTNPKISPKKDTKQIGGAINISIIDPLAITKRGSAPKEIPLKNSDATLRRRNAGREAVSSVGC
jgi:hypothetical protein